VSEPQDFNPREMLTEARAQMQRLLDELLHKQSQLAEPSARMTPAQLAEGQKAIDDAIVAARAALDTINEALAQEAQS